MLSAEQALYRTRSKINTGKHNSYENYMKRKRSIKSVMQICNAM